MNKRLKKKEAKKKLIIKKKRCFPEISKKICPICGEHTIIENDLFICCSCKRKYSKNEVATAKTTVTQSEYQRIKEQWETLRI